MERLDLDTYYLKIAQAVAQRATCLRKQYGAVLVHPIKGIVSTGYNGAPVGEAHCTICTKNNHGKDLSTFLECKSVHAEMNCIINAAKEEMLGADLYLVCYDVTSGKPIEREAWPCEICLRLIKNAGIQRVINKTGVIYERDSNGILRKA